MFCYTPTCLFYQFLYRALPPGPDHESGDQLGGGGAAPRGRGLRVDRHQGPGVRRHQVPGRAPRGRRDHQGQRGSGLDRAVRGCWPLE